MTIPNCFLAEIPLHVNEIIPRQLQIVSQPKFHCISSKSFWDFSRLCLSRNSIAPHLNYSDTFLKCVLAQIQIHLIECSLRQFQIVSQPKFHCISSKLFWDFSRLCLSQNSIAPHLNFSNTFPNYVLAQIHSLLIEIILRQFQLVS